MDLFWGTKLKVRQHSAKDDSFSVPIQTRQMQMLCAATVQAHIVATSSPVVARSSVVSGKSSKQMPAEVPIKDPPDFSQPKKQQPADFLRRCR